MVWKILSALSAVCLGTACYFAWSNQKMLVEERHRETFANANLADLKAHIVKADEAKKKHEAQLATANQELESTKTAVADTATKAQAKEQELAVLKTNLDQITKIVSDNQKQIDEAGDIKSLLAQIDSIKKERAEAEAALANQTQHLAAAQERITNLTNAAKEAEEREARGRRGIVDDNFTAKVTHAYTDWGFVVLNKGNGGGVFANADLEVKRGKDVVAKLKVRDVEQNSSVADLLKVSTFVPVIWWSQPPSKVPRYLPRKQRRQLLARLLRHLELPPLPRLQWAVILSARQLPLRHRLPPWAVILSARQLPLQRRLPPWALILSAPLQPLPLPVVPRHRPARKILLGPPHLPNDRFRQFVS